MLIYKLAVSLYNLAVFLAKPFNRKAALLYEGRRKAPGLLAGFVRHGNRKLAWFHCASLGEFEQARPLIERLKQECDIQIVISFFSPSGYEIRKNYELADLVFYLPPDSPQNARKVLDALRPDMVFFVKYEIWIHYIRAIAGRKIPLYLISATFRPGHLYFKWYGKHLRKALQLFDVIFTQDRSSLDLLRREGLTNGVFSNDTRYDRVYRASLDPQPLPVIEQFRNGQPLLVLGSSYAPEEHLALRLLGQRPGLKIVIAPHNIGPQRISDIENLFRATGTCRYSEALRTGKCTAPVLIIDNIGLLSAIYRYADLALVGGGFGKKGLHNTLEAAAFGMPVFTGPHHHERFPETALLKQEGVLITVTGEQEFVAKAGGFLDNPSRLEQARITAKSLVKNNTGATQTIMDRLRPGL